MADAIGRRARLATLAALLGASMTAAGCETINDNVDFKVLEPSRPQAPTPPARLENANMSVVDTVERLEIGTTRQGLLLSAFGFAPRQGWFQPELRPLNNGLPAPDGFLEFEFIAAPPELNEGDPLPVGVPAQRRIKAVRPIPRLALSSAAGVRVFAGRGAPAALRFNLAPPEEAEPSRARPPAPSSGPALPTVGG